MKKVSTSFWRVLHRVMMTSLLPICTGATFQRLIHYAQRRGANDAEGIADLAFLDAVNALSSMRSWGEAVFRAYVYRATRSRISGDGRRKTVDTVMLDDAIDIAEPGSIEDAVISQRSFDDLLAGLSPGQRDVVVHRILGGFSVAETAARLGRSPGAVKQLQFQGLTRLRAAVLWRPSCFSLPVDLP